MAEWELDNVNATAADLADMRAAIGAPNRIYRTAYDVVAGSGVLAGQTTDSGHTWSVSGTGVGTTSINPAGYIEGTDNTYCMINTGSKVHRAVQLFSGAQCTIAIMLDSTLSDMLHVNFGSGAVSGTYWKTGLGSSIALDFGVAPNPVPDINDDTPHELIVDVVGDWMHCYVDGIHVASGYHPDISAVTGNWMFAQIHGAGDKIYGVTGYTLPELTSAEELESLKAGQVDANALSAYSLMVGNFDDATFAPEYPIYLWHQPGQRVQVGSGGTSILEVVATNPGSPAYIFVESFIGVAFSVECNGSGVSKLQHQGTDRISFPFNAARTDAVVPLHQVLASGASDPTTSDVAASYGTWWKNTSNGEIRWWYNDAGTMKKSAALTT